VSWGVWCTVRGGVTGSRAAWAKASGKRLKFETKDEASAAARAMRESVTVASATSGVGFGYYPMLLDEVIPDDCINCDGPTVDRNGEPFCPTCNTEMETSK